MLSLSMIVRDEAERLPACLASVAGFVDEMVVVDTGSSDDTAAVAARCGAVVLHLPWPGDFAPARNRALEWVRGDWVLVLDADERLRPEARDSLRQLMADPDALLITLLRRELGAAQSPYSSVSRLFRRHPEIRWQRAYHSLVDDSVAALLSREPHWRVLACPVPALLHDGYRPELLAAGDKEQRLRAAMEQELRQRPGDPYTCAKLGALEIAGGHRQRGLALLHSGLEHCGADDHPERFELLLHLGIGLAPQDPAAAAGRYREALALPLEPRLAVAALVNLAALELRGGRQEEASALARQATAAAPELPLAWFNLGLIERQGGDLGAAASAYDTAIRLDPDHADAHRNRAVVRLLRGDIPGARQGFRDAITRLKQQGRADEATALQQQASGLVRLDDG
jgi:tetratricopeptide (TPR) repeat protein